MIGPTPRRARKRANSWTLLNFCVADRMQQHKASTAYVALRGYVLTPLP